MKLRPGSVNRSSRAVLWVAVARFVVCFGSVSCAQTQTVQTIRLVDYRAPSHPLRLAMPHSTIQTNATSIAESKGRDLDDNIIKPTTATSADRWMKFESEYGIEQESPSPIGRMFQAAKYGLDRMAFTAQETAKRLEFTYDLGDVPANATGSRAAPPEYSLPMFGRFGHAQLKSEVTIHDPQTGEAFIGLKLAIPFGQGG